LVNALAGATIMGVQAIRRADGRGRHTTTFRSLVPLPAGGCVLDTPGIRAVGLFDSLDGLDRTFADIDALARACRFRDCEHNAEPGCTVVEAIATGELSMRRLLSWRNLRREIGHEMRRHDARLAGQERLRWRRERAQVRRTARP
jgi:ribosome biogenesis GTPase